MTLEAIYYISQILAVLAILASLIFVGLQVREAKTQSEQTNRLARAQLSATTWLETSTHQDRWYATEESSKFMARAFASDKPLELHEKMRFSVRMVSVVSAVELAYTLWRQGLFEEKLYTRYLRTFAVYAESPRFQKWWHNVGRNYYIPPFQGLIDEIIMQQESPANEKGNAEQIDIPPEA